MAVEGQRVMTFTKIYIGGKPNRFDFLKNTNRNSDIGQKPYLCEMCRRFDISEKLDTAGLYPPDVCPSNKKFTFAFSLLLTKCRQIVIEYENRISEMVCYCPGDC